MVEGIQKDRAVRVLASRVFSKSTMDPRLFLQTPSATQYFFDGRSAVAASRLTTSLQYYAPHHYYYQHQRQLHWDAMSRVWNQHHQTATSHDRKFSVDSILSHSDTWRSDHESVSRLEISDLSGKLRQRC